MSRAGALEPVPPGDAPVSILLDYDGTIALSDVTDTLLELHATDPRWRMRDDDYVAGAVGSRELLAWDTTILPADRDLLLATADAQPLDPAVPAFVRGVQARGALVEVVSDGFGFYVERALERLGIPDVALATAETSIRDGTMGIEFPFGHPGCHVCGTCKRERVLAHRAAGRAVVFVGDGESDRYAAAAADVIYAKGRLVAMCERYGWQFERWTSFDDLAHSVAAAFDDRRLPGPGDDLESWRDLHGSRRPLICGPEVWGPNPTRPGG